jgi:hypothetical protein
VVSSPQQVTSNTKKILNESVHPQESLRVSRGFDRALLRLLFGGVRDDDPADLLFTFVDALNEDPVV